MGVKPESSVPCARTRAGTAWWLQEEERGWNLRGLAVGRESSIHTQASEVPSHGQGKRMRQTPYSLLTCPPAMTCVTSSHIIPVRVGHMAVLTCREHKEDSLTWAGRVKDHSVCKQPEMFPLREMDFILVMGRTCQREKTVPPNHEQQGVCRPHM